MLDNVSRLLQMVSIEPRPNATATNGDLANNFTPFHCGYESKGFYGTTCKFWNFNGKQNNSTPSEEEAASGLSNDSHILNPDAQTWGSLGVTKFESFI